MRFQCRKQLLSISLNCPHFSLGVERLTMNPNPRKENQMNILKFTISGAALGVLLLVAAFLGNASLHAQSATKPTYKVVVASNPAAIEQTLNQSDADGYTLAGTTSDMRQAVTILILKSK